MSIDNTYIPRRLDDPWKIGLWDIDVAIPWLFCFGIFYVALGGFMGIVGGIVTGTIIARTLGRLKADKHAAFALHWAYWSLPSGIVHLACVPPSHHRRLIG